VQIVNLVFFVQYSVVVLLRVYYILRPWVRLACQRAYARLRPQAPSSSWLLALQSPTPSGLGAPLLYGPDADGPPAATATAAPSDATSPEDQGGDYREGEGGQTDGDGQSSATPWPRQRRWWRYVWTWLRVEVGKVKGGFRAFPLYMKFCIYTCTIVSLVAVIVPPLLLPPEKRVARYQAQAAALGQGVCESVALVGRRYFDSG
jgi:hypothetical protein